MTTHIKQFMKINTVRVILTIATGLMLFTSNAAYSLTNKQFLASMLPDSCHFAGEFKQTKKIKALPKPLASNGGFLYSCKLGLIWETKAPIKESLVFSKTKLNFSVKDDKFAENLESVQHDFLAKLLLGLMAGNIQLLEKQFELEEGEADPEETTLTLVPKGKLIKDAIQSVILEKKPGQDDSLFITITDKNEQITFINTKEIARYTDDKGFKDRCTSKQYFTKACTLLLDPERVREN